MNNLRKQIRAWASLTWYSFRAMTRNKSSFAFGFIFPVVFITIFGLVGSGSQEIKLGIPNDSNLKNPITNVIVNQKFIKPSYDSEQALEKSLRDGKISGILQVNTGSKTHPYDVNLIISSANPIAASQVQGFIKGIVDQANLQATGIKDPPIAFKATEISGRQSRYIDFALPGQIGFSMLGTAIFGTVFGLIYLKKALILKRMLASPVRPIVLLRAQGTSRLVMAMIQTTIIVALGVVAFHFYLPHGIWTFIQILILSAFGLTAFLGFGYFMSGFAKDENSAGPLVNLITLPQLLLSGTFFATDNLPSWIQPIANNLPLSYFNIAIRKMTSEGANLPDVWPYLLGLAIWGGIMYILAAKTFKWEP